MRKLLILIIAACMMLTSCGDSGGAEEEQSPTPPKPSPTASAPPEPDYGGTLRLSMRQPLTLNPLLNEDETVDRILKLVFEPLFILDDELYPRPNPALVSGYTAAADMKSVNITIRDDIYWSNGERITAADVAFSVEYLRRNAPADAIYKDCAANLLSANVTGNSVRITLIQPSGQIGYMLCFPIIPASYYTNVPANNEKQMSPVGNGMYRFESYTKTRELRLKASETSAGEPPYITDISVVITVSDENDMHAFEQGVIDAIVTGIDSRGRIRTSGETRYIEFVTGYFDFIGFNFDRWHLTDKNIRRAIAYAVPYDNILESVYKNSAVLSPAPVNPASWLASPEYARREYSLELAAECIEGWEGLEFRVLVSEENAEGLLVAELLKNNLEVIGISVTIQPKPWEEYLKAIETRDFDILLGGYKLSDVPDLSFMLHSGNAGGNNIFNYKNERMDQLLANAFAVSGEMAAAAFRDLQDCIYDELPLIGLVFRKATLQTGENVHGALNIRSNNAFSNVNEWFIKVK